MIRSKLTILAIIYIFLFIAITSYANTKNNVAVLRFHNEEKVMRNQEVMFIEESIRSMAAKKLYKKDYQIYTNDNLLEMLAANDIQMCIAEGDCEVETMRIIQAQYGITGNILKFGDKINVVMKVYNSLTGNLLGSEIIFGNDLNEIYDKIKPATSNLINYIIFDKNTDDSNDQVISKETEMPYVSNDNTKISIITNPTDAKVFSSDRKRIGNTPLKNYPWKSGNDYFLISKDNYKVYPLKVNLKPNKLNTFNVNLVIQDGLNNYVKRAKIYQKGFLFSTGMFVPFTIFLALFAATDSEGVAIIIPAIISGTSLLSATAFLGLYLENKSHLAENTKLNNSKEIMLSFKF
ncbi:MAG: PEGA domain-containing protein [Pseudomonadota bacterium]